MLALPSQSATSSDFSEFCKMRRDFHFRFMPLYLLALPPFQDEAESPFVVRQQARIATSCQGVNVKRKREGTGGGGLVG